MAPSHPHEQGVVAQKGVHPRRDFRPLGGLRGDVGGIERGGGGEALRDARAGELLAEELRLAQRALGTITGEVTADDLLGRIFSEFCIGK